MRQGKNAPGWPKKPWTIIATPRYTGKGIGHYYYAYNLLTRQMGPYRDTCEAATLDIERGYVFQNTMAEPWGV